MAQPFIDRYWYDFIMNERKEPYFQQLTERIRQAYREGPVYPPRDKIFRALMLTPYDEVKVVIIGQDPYYQPGVANGLAFSVNRNQPIPQSLHNIYLELQADLGLDYPPHGDLTQWAQQGVLLLNTVLTVSGGKPNSHRGFGWEVFTDRIIERLNDSPHRLIFLLWGAHAQEKAKIVDGTRHFILKAAHPSPRSAHRGFFGCRHFSQTNRLLRQIGRMPINWQIR